MARNTQSLTVSLPPDIVERVNQMTHEQGRTKSAVLLDALERYFDEQEWKQMYQQVEQKAKESRIYTEDQVDELVHARREREGQAESRA